MIYYQGIPIGKVLIKGIFVNELKGGHYAE
jgi:hypothetical protein